MWFISEQCCRVSLCQGCMMWLWASHRTAGAIFGFDIVNVEENLLAYYVDPKMDKTPNAYLSMFMSESGIAFHVSNTSSSGMVRFSISLHLCSCPRVWQGGYCPFLLSESLPKCSLHSHNCALSIHTIYGKGSEKRTFLANTVILRSNAKHPPPPAEPGLLTLETFVQRVSWLVISTMRWNFSNQSGSPTL